MSQETSELSCGMDNKKKLGGGHNVQMLLFCLFGGREELNENSLI